MDDGAALVNRQSKLPRPSRSNLQNGATSGPIRTFPNSRLGSSAEPPAHKGTSIHRAMNGARARTDQHAACERAFSP